MPEESKQKQACPAFAKLLILDWYDGVLLGVGCDSKEQSWFCTWAVIHTSGQSRSLYAVRAVSDEWVDGLLGEIAQSPKWPRWSPRLSDAQGTKVKSRVERLFVAQPETVVLAWYSDLGTCPDAYTAISPETLGEYASPSTIEELYGQTAEEKQGLESLLISLSPVIKGSDPI